MRVRWPLACVALFALIFVSDYVTGYELSLSPLYLVPVFIGTWKGGRNFGIALAALAALTWSASDVLAGHHYSRVFFHYWEGFIKLISFAIFAILLARLKEALANADERFVTVLEGLDAAVHVSDMETGALLYVNEQFKAAFGAPAGSGNISEVDSRFQPSTSICFGRDQLVTADGAAGQVLQGEFQDLQSKRWYLIRARAIRWVNGRLVRLQAATDITDSKRSDEISRQQQEKLQLTSRLITAGEMATTLAHELNQPLAAISNYNMGCVRRLRSGNWNSADLLAAMEKGSAQAERARKIIQRVRDFLRKREPQLSPCELNEIVRDIVSMVELDADDRHVGVALDLKPSLPVVLADKVMIEQVILNLVKNAVEAMQEMPSDRRRLLIRSALSGPHSVEISVSDTGRGIPPEMIENLFTPFFTTKRDGMGMGLHICRSIVEFHDGRLWGTLNPGGGSTFRFTLPAEID